MRCPFCAEVIQDEAILCRFCGAQKSGASWAPPAVAKVARKKKGELTIKISAALFMFSACLELLPPTSPVPLFGASRTGVVAVLYHIMYAAMFGALGAGLWKWARWAYTLTFVSTVVYSIDRIQFMASPATRAASLDQYRAYTSIIGPGMMDAMSQWLVVTSMLSMVSYWGFAFYVYLRRREFETS